jgi:hypothetical protein
MIAACIRCGHRIAATHGRLVADRQPGPPCKHARQLAALGLAAAQGPVQRARQIGVGPQPDAAQTVGQVVDLRAAGEEVPDAQCLEARGLLPGQRHAAPRALVQWQRVDAFAREVQFARDRRITAAAEHRVRNRALARSVRTEQRVHFTVGDRERKAAEHDATAEFDVQLARGQQERVRPVRVHGTCRTDAVRFNRLRCTHRTRAAADNR